MVVRNIVELRRCGLKLWMPTFAVMVTLLERKPLKLYGGKFLKLYEKASGKKKADQ
jgi:hypothetical protein